MEKPKYNLWQNSGYMIAAAWKRHKPVLWLCIITAALSVAASTLGIFIAPSIIYAVETAAPIGRLVFIILAFAGALLMVGAAEAYVATNILFGRVVVRSVITSRIHEKICKTSYPNIENQDVRKKMEKAAIATQSNSEAAEAIWTTLTDLLKNIAGFVIYLLLMSSLPIWIFALILGTTILGFFVNRYVNGWGFRHRDEEAQYTRKMRYIIRSSSDHTLAKDVRIFGMKDWLNDVFDSGLRAYRGFIARREKVYIWGNIVDTILSFARNGIAYFYLIHLVVTDNLSASTFVLTFAVIGGFTTWVGGILTGFETLHKQSLDITAVREFIEYHEPFKFTDGTPLAANSKSVYEIELRNVSFCYPGAERNSLENITLKIKPGEKLAVVGLNGAGKTTLVKLICGFYDPTKGEVLLNGQDIRQYNRHDYYAHFSAVFQDFSIIATTIGENVTQTDMNVDENKMKECIEKAGLTEKVNSLPNKFDTHVTKLVYEDGIELSGGETQRLMLARALYKNAPVIILDEPTAALDPIAESDIYNKYNEMAGGRTSVYISHRLASTKFCDRVIFIDDGSITEEGTHDELLRLGGKYSELYEIQSHYYRENPAIVSHPV